MSTAPRRSIARKGPNRDIPTAEAKAKVLDLIAQGLKTADAMAAVGRAPATYTDWYKKDAAFQAAVKASRRALEQAGETGRLPVPDFPEFCEMLGRPLHPHQLQMWDVLEGRPPRELPRDMLPRFRYQPGVEWETAGEQHVAGRVIINAPPGNGKTVTFSTNYMTWQIYRNPDIRIIVVCKDQGLAKQILGAVKFQLQSPVYREMHLKYAPVHANGEVGWKDPDSSWTQTEIYVHGRGSGEKDPTMQALGIGGRIYGARSDIIFLDDAITLANVNEYEKQARWLDQEVESRLDGAGLLALLGTRVAPSDLYSYQRAVTDADDESVYTYFSMPMLLDEGDGKPDSWLSLWPYMTCGEHAKGAHQRCMYCYELPDDCSCEYHDIRWMTGKFTPKKLRKIRRDETQWALVYQQQDVAEDATFNAKAIDASINRERFPGPLTKGAMGHRLEGMDGLWRVGTVDPAAAGHTAMIVGGVERSTGRRYVIDGFNNRNTSAQQLKDTIKRFTVAYDIQEWVIEVNAFQRYLTQDAELVDFLRGRGCRLSPHMTTSNKLDPDFGVMAMAPLFMSCGEPPGGGHGGPWVRTPDKALIELPNPRQNAWVAELINQLVTWQPSGLKQGHKTDLVMALWFFDIAARRVLGHGENRVTHMNNPFLSKARSRARQVVNLADLRAASLEIGAA